MRFCTVCATPLTRAIPAGDDRERHVCPACGHIHYENPKVVAGCIVAADAAILLCRRAIEPQKGLWTVPAGFLELGESSIEGAKRETWEEAQAQVQVEAPFAHLDLPHIGQIYMLYRARLARAGFGAGPESMEVRWCALRDIPWGQLAFPVVEVALRLYLDDHAQSRFGLHHATVRKHPAGASFTEAAIQVDAHRRWAWPD